MMKTLELLFTWSLGIMIYTYFGYGLFMYILSLFKKSSEKPGLKDEDLPAVTHIIAAYNEADYIHQKIQNCRDIDYPGHKVTTIIVTDGSTDLTPNFVSRHSDMLLMHSSRRAGKLEAVKRAMTQVETPYVIFSDANTTLNRQSFKKMISHFQSNLVGAVAGEKKIRIQNEDDAAAAGEGIYWKYESFLKRLDSKIGSATGAAGELFAIRTALFEAPKKDVLIEDFFLSIDVVRKGYQLKYEPDAYAEEEPSASIHEEMKRKIRISAGGLQATWRLKGLLNFFKYGVFSLQLFSHRFLRWTLAPLAILMLFVSNMFFIDVNERLYTAFFLAQVVFYLMGILGYVLSMKKVKIKVFFIPFYFLFMNLNIYLGLFKLISGKYSVNWEKAERRA